MGQDKCQKVTTNGNEIPRILFAAPKSGSGKTLLTCGFLQALKKRGFAPCSFKCGPDYIDPMFHRKVLGIPGANLDSYFLEEEAVRECFLRCVRRNGSDLAVIEGVMGYYDGVGGIHTKASTYDIARITETPVVLVLDGKGTSLSLAALIKGFAGFRKDSRIRGFILNRTSLAVFERLAPQIEAETGIAAAGYLPEVPKYQFESRHLGLFLPEEIGALEEKLDKLAEQMEQTMDMERLIAIAQGEKRTENRQADLTKPEPCSKRSSAAEPGKVRIGVARDEAFCFYYEENLELLKAQGAELISFSPLHDRRLPEGICGLLLGGGYPENYAGALSGNLEMLCAVRKAWQQEIPVLAECGGFLYLHETLEGSDGYEYPMVGAYRQRACNRGKLGRFGYISLTAPDGTKIKGHEFHYWESSDPGMDWLAEKPASELKWRCIHQDGARISGFPHLYYQSAPSFTEQWLKKCRAWRG